jgi:hypothetical protein
VSPRDGLGVMAKKNISVSAGNRIMVVQGVTVTTLTELSRLIAESYKQWKCVCVCVCVCVCMYVCTHTTAFSVYGSVSSYKTVFIVVCTSSPMPLSSLFPSGVVAKGCRY